MLLPDTDGGTAHDIAERLRERVAAVTFPVVRRITISLGVALWSPALCEIDQALKSADEALYRAKKQGRDQVVVG